MTTRDAVLAEARRWLGAKWRHQARVRYVACDCGQLLLDVFVQVGLINDFDVEKYARQWALHQRDERFLEIIQQHAWPVVAPLPGDIAVFKVDHCFSHAAIVVDWPMIIHAHIHEGVVLTDASVGRLAACDRLFFTLFEGA